MKIRRICVYCGSSKGESSLFSETAQALGEAIANRGLGLVYGGGNVGLMGIVANAALAKGGEVIGVITEGLVKLEVAHKGLPDLRVVNSMHERKALMADLSGAFIALPGGFGTMDELFEILTWSQLGIHAKPVGLLNMAGYYDELLAFLASMERHGFVRAEHSSHLLSAKTVDDLLFKLTQAPEGKTVAKWR